MRIVRRKENMDMIGLKLVRHRQGWNYICTEVEKKMGFVYLTRLDIWGQEIIMRWKDADIISIKKMKHNKEYLYWIS